MLGLLVKAHCSPIELGHYAHAPVLHAGPVLAHAHVEPVVRSSLIVIYSKISQIDKEFALFSIL